MTLKISTPDSLVDAIDSLMFNLFKTDVEKRQLLTQLVSQKRFKEADSYLSKKKLRKKMKGQALIGGDSILSRLKPKRRTIYVRSIERNGRIKALYPQEFFPKVIEQAKESEFKPGSFSRLTELLEKNPPGKLYPLDGNSEKIHFELRSLLFYNFLAKIYGDHRFYIYQSAKFQIDKGSLSEGTEAAHHMHPVEYTHKNNGQNLLLHDLKNALFCLRKASREKFNFSRGYGKKAISEIKEDIEKYRNITYGILDFFETYQMSQKIKRFAKTKNDIDAIIGAIETVKRVNDKQDVELYFNNLCQILGVKIENGLLENDENILLEKLESRLTKQLTIISNARTQKNFDIEEELVIELFSLGVEGKKIDALFRKAVDHNKPSQLAKNFILEQFNPTQDDPVYPNLFL